MTEFTFVLYAVERGEIKICLERTQLGLGHDWDSRRSFLSSGEIEMDQSSGEIERIYWHLAYSHARSSRSNDIAFGIPTSNCINRNIVRYRPAPHRDYIGKKFRNAVHVNWTKICPVPVSVLPFLFVVRPRSAADRADRRA